MNMTGSGLVTLNNTNTFTGAVNIAGGTLAIGSAAAIGSVSQVNLLNGGTLQSNGANVSTDRTINVDSTGGAINVGSTNTLTSTTHLTGSGPLAKTGTGTYVMGAASPTTVVRSGSTAVTNINGGTVRIASVNANGVSGLGSGNVNINNGGTLDIGAFAGFQTDGTTPGTGLTVMVNDGGTLVGSTANGRISGSVQIPASGSVTLGAPAAADRLVIGNSVRNQGAGGQTTSTTINVTGNGVVQLASGGTSTSASGTQFSGTGWNVNMGSTGVLSVGPILNGGFGETINALGYIPPATGGGATTPYRGVTRPVTVNSGTLAIGSDLGNYTSSLPLDINSFRSPITLNGGAIAPTGKRITGASGSQAANGPDVVPQIHGPVTLTANSTVKLYDPTLASPASGAARSIDFVTDNAAIQPETGLMVANDFTWGANNLNVVAGSGGGQGRLAFKRTAGTVSVNPGASITIGPAAVVELAGTVDALSDGDHVNVNLSGGDLETTAGTKNVGNVAGTGNVFAVGGATLIANHVRASNIVVASGTVQTRATGGTATGTSKVNTVSITGTGKVDIKDNKLISTNAVGTGAVGGGAYTDGSVSRFVQTASNGGAWDGPGLTTSMPDAPNGLTSIGVALASDVRDFGLGTTLLFGGQTITTTSTLAMYTYAGDANLDGAITGDDYSGIDFTIQDPNNTGGWFNGDFNYDGFVSGDDYSAIDFNILAQGAPFPTAGAAQGLSGVTAVPEPATLSVLGLGAAALMGRRRRRAK
jgi:autotransporter-associated beta strand protein